MAQMKRKIIKQAPSKRFQFSNRTLLGVVFASLAGGSFWIYCDTQSQIQALELKKQEALQHQEDLIKERDYLKTKIDLLTNEEYFLDYAKKKLLYANEGEILFIFPEDY